MVCSIRMVKILSELKNLFVLMFETDKIILLNNWLLRMSMCVIAQELFFIHHDCRPLLLSVLKYQINKILTCIKFWFGSFALLIFHIY